MALSTVRVPKQFTSWIIHTGLRSGIQPLPDTVKCLPMVHLPGLFSGTWVGSPPPLPGCLSPLPEQM